MAVLDTSFLIDVSYNINTALEKLDELKNKGEVMYISTPALYEFLSGIQDSPNPQQKKEEALGVLGDQIIIFFDEECAKIGAKIWSELAKRGELIDDIDIMIAATAINTSQLLITKNERHFQRISGLRIETYV